MNFFISFHNLALCILFKLFSIEKAEDFCQSETLNADCRTNEIVVVKQSFYGRMKLGRCVESSLGYINCYTDVLAIADSLCSGRRSCKISVPNSHMDSTEPCNKELKTYLQIEYSCIPVVTPEPVYCTSGHPYQLNQDFGLLANDLESCHQQTWIIKVLPGQRIEFQLYDFSTWPLIRVKSDKAEATDCVAYGYIVEREAKVNETICGGGGGDRVKVVRLSRGSTAEITLHKFEEISFPARFAVRFRSQGCADLNPPIGAQYLRLNDSASITCLETDQSWHLNCVEGNWHGVIGNCSASFRHSRLLLYHEAYPIANLILIFIVITVAIVLATTILLVGIFIVRTKRPVPSIYTKYEASRSMKSCDYFGDVSRQNYLLPSHDIAPRLYPTYSTHSENGDSNLYAPILEPVPFSLIGGAAPFSRRQVDRTEILPPPIM